MIKVNSLWRIPCGILPAMLFLVTASVHADEEQWRKVLQAIDRAPIQQMADAEQSVSQARAKGDKAAELTALRRLAMAASVSDAPGRAWEAIVPGEKLARGANDLETLCEILTLKAMHIVLVQNYSEANSILEEASTIARGHNLQTRLAWILWLKASIASIRNRSGEATEFTFQAYDLFSTLHDEYGMAKSLAILAEGMGSPSASEEDLKKALGYEGRILNLLSIDKYGNEIVLTYLDIGTFYFRLNDNKRSRKAYEQAFLLSRKIGKFQLATITEDRLAKLDLIEGHYEDALRHSSTEEHADLMKLERKVYYIKHFLIRAEALANLNRLPESLALLSQAREYITRYAALTDDINAQYHEVAGKIRAKAGDFREAYQHILQYQQIKTKIQNEENAKLASELNIRFDVRQKETENALLKLEAKQSKDRTLIIVLLFVLALLLVSGLALLLRRRTLEARREAQHHLALANVEVSANRAKSVFLARMSHELRSPLNAIIGFSRLLLRDAPQATQSRENLETILKSGEHLHALINEVLDLSKIEAGRSTLTERDADLHQILEEMEEMFALSAADKGFQLIIDYDAAVPRYVRVDFMRLRQILINLLDNAIKFTSEGSVSLIVRRCDDAHNGLPSACMLSFAVEDTGVGIAPEELGMLGHAFNQAQAGLREPEGTGLGLAISRGFIELMGGTLRISSQPDKGTRMEFTIVLQTTQAGVGAVQAAGDFDSIAGLAPGSACPRILVVDDRVDGRKLLVQLFGGLGCEVREAINGAEAVAQWQTWSPEFICMDMNMPVMNGREAVRRIRAMPGGGKPVIVALTASSMGQERERILQEGCDDYLANPVRDKELFALLHKHLGVEFVYHEKASTPAARLDNARLASMPPALREELCAALAALDIEAILRIIAALRGHDTALAAALQELAAGYEYEKMQTLLKQDK